MSKYFKVKNTTNICLNSSYNCTRSASVAFTKTTNGAGYTFTPNILIANTTGDAGYGGSIIPTMVAGGISSITSTNGQNYSQLPTVSVTGIIGYTSLVAGSGYTLPPLITASGSGGYGFVAETRLTGTTVGGYIIDSGGSGYTNGSITFSAVGTSGIGFTASVIVTSGVITSVTILTAGSGFTFPPTFVSAPSGTGAKIRFLLTASTVSTIVCTNAGYNYPATGTTFTFTNPPNGSGSGVSAIPTITPTTLAVITPSFLRTYSYTWEKIPTITINDFGKLSVLNFIANTLVSTTQYSIRIKNIQYTSKDYYNSDFGDPLLGNITSTATTTYSALPTSLYTLTLTPQNIDKFSIILDDSITSKNTGVAGMVNFIIVLQIEEFDPVTTEINDVYRESASRLRLNY